MSQRVETIFGCPFLTIVDVDVIRYQRINGSKHINGYVIRYRGRTLTSQAWRSETIKPTHVIWVVDTSYDSYQAEYGKAACLTVLANDDRGPTPVQSGHASLGND